MQGSTRALPPAAHRDYLAFQRGLARRVEELLEDALGPPSARLHEYFTRYLRDVASYSRVSTKAALVREAARSRVVLGGDYHTFDQAKRTHVRILRKVLRVRRSAVLGLECFPSDRQADLDAYVAGTLGEDELLARTRFRETWGFDWIPYRGLLVFARTEGMAITALDMPYGNGRRSLAARDRHMAGVVAATVKERPDALVYVIVGDWHLAREHLPREVELATGISPLLIYQNSDAIYWKLASRGLEQLTDVVVVRKRAFCVVNATPFVKLASFALGAGQSEAASRLASEGVRARAADVEPGAEAAEAGLEPLTDPADAVGLLVHAIADYLELDVPVDFALLDADDEGLIPRLVQELGHLGPDAMHEITVLHLYRRTMYFPSMRAIYLGSATPNAMADAASRYLHHAASGDDGLPEDPRAAFYVRVLREAVTFLGANIINHKRPYLRRADHEAIVAAGKGRRRMGVAQERFLASRAYLEHRAIEKRVLDGGGRLPPPSARIYHLKPVVRWGLTRSLGQALGHKLHQSLVRGRLPKPELADLFRENFGTLHDPCARYLELVRRTRQVKALVRERGERL